MKTRNDDNSYVLDRIGTLIASAYSQALAGTWNVIEVGDEEPFVIKASSITTSLYTKSLLLSSKSLQAQHKRRMHPRVPMEIIIARGRNEDLVAPSETMRCHSFSPMPDKIETLVYAFNLHEPLLFQFNPQL